VRVGVVGRAQLLGDLLDRGDLDRVVGDPPFDPAEPPSCLSRADLTVVVAERIGSARSSSSLMPSRIGSTSAR